MMRILLLALLLSTLSGESVTPPDSRKLHRTAERIARLKDKLQKEIDRFNEQAKPIAESCAKAKGTLQVDGFGNYVCLVVPEGAKK